MSAAFYCVADARYFPGAVALINSLRLHGHREPIYVLDCGLGPGHAERLAGEATVVEPVNDAPAWLAKTSAPLRHPADVMVLIDADMIATRPLDELISHAAEGRVIAFRNDVDRFVPEWGELLDLGPIRRRPYVSSGLVLLGGATGREVLELLDDRQRRVDVARGFAGRDEPGYPFRYPEQDVLNAILCTRVEPAEAIGIEHRLAPTLPFDGIRLVDRSPPRCAYADGTEPYVLHHFDRRPWLERVRSNVYSRLLTGLLLEPGLPLRLEPAEVPARLRNGPAAEAERLATDLLLTVPGVARRLRERGARPTAAEGTGPR